MKKWHLKPKDIAAIIIAGTVMSFKLAGFDGALDTVIALIAGYYFGHRVSGQDAGV